MTAGAAPRIDRRHRLGLAAKGLFLFALGGVLLSLAIVALRRDSWPWVARLGAALVFGFFGAFTASLTPLAIVDAFAGIAVKVDGAVALRSRKAGHSLKLPDGRYAEYLLFNEWDALVPGSSYTVTLAQRSRVIVERPQPTS